MDMQNKVYEMYAKVFIPGWLDEDLRLAVQRLEDYIGDPCGLYNELEAEWVDRLWSIEAMVTRGLIDEDQGAFLEDQISEVLDDVEKWVFEVCDDAEEDAI